MSLSIYLSNLHTCLCPYQPTYQSILLTTYVSLPGTATPLDLPREPPASVVTVTMQAGLSAA
jgi:hypothetical protein